MILSGLLGRSILASRSPWLHEQEAQAQGLDLTYTLFDFTARGHEDADLASVLIALRDEGYAGVNITFPFKQAVMALLDDLAESAEAVGAVNTIAMRGGRMIGHNTDMTGFRDSLTLGLPHARLEQVLQFGAGGAGAAVATALLALGVGRLHLSDVDYPRATDLAARLAARFGANRVVAREVGDQDTADIDGIVNATPIGMASAPGSPIPASRLMARHWVSDIVYFPLETQLLRDARERGCATLDGSGMVTGQAAMAFEIITGHAADRDRMRASFVAPTP